MTLEWAEELQYQVTDHLGLFLLDPMTSAFEEMHTTEIGARTGLHLFDGARSLVDAPVVLA